MVGLWERQKGRKRSLKTKEGNRGRSSKRAKDKNSRGRSPELYGMNKERERGVYELVGRSRYPFDVECPHRHYYLTLLTSLIKKLYPLSFTLVWKVSFNRIELLSLQTNLI